MKEKRKLPKKIIALIVCGVIIATLLLTCLGAEIAFLVADNTDVWHPDYSMESIDEQLDKWNGENSLSQCDYDFIYSQTGLTKTGADRALARGESGKRLIRDIQKDYFAPRSIEHNKIAPFTCMDFADTIITPVYLKDGDIVVSPCTNLAGWRMGHSGLVCDGAANRVLHALTYGTTSQTDSINYFTGCNAFMILEVDTDRQKEVVTYAKENLLGIPYEGLTGIITNKNKIQKTQCAHLVWYAYKQIGIDLDSNGGLIVTPQNLANSPHVKVVQIYGYDPVKLWK